MKTRTKRTSDLAEYFQQRRDDSDEWHDKAEAAVVERSTSVVYSLRLKPSELTELRRAASTRGVALSELIRTSALQHIRESDVAGPNVSAFRVKFFTRSKAPSAGTKGPPPATATLANVPETATA